MKNPIDHLSGLFAKRKPFAKLAQEFCSYLRKTFPHYAWVGIYMIEGGDTLVLKAWDGPEATEHVRIPVGEGICGLAAREERSVVVDDVNKDPRYLQCFLRTRSEIVVPIFAGKKVVGEIDIDGDKPAAYNETDRLFLEWCAARLGATAPG
ncbi:MAG: GAF domain-containing protein [Planctomycetes bacterium]|nr:GAF domain-containing protein [Planctomycetota bacterium]